MNKIYLIFTLVLLLLGQGCSPKFKMSKQNVSNNYQIERHIFYDTRAEQDSLRIYLRFNDVTPFSGAAKPETRIVYSLKPSYEEHATLLQDSIRNIQERMLVTEQFALFDFTIAVNKLRNPALLVLQIGPPHIPEGQVFIDIPLTDAVFQKDYVLLEQAGGIPIFRNYMNNFESIYIDAFQESAASIAKHFDVSYAPALPPMSMQADGTPPTIKVKQRLPFAPEEPVFLPETGLYLIERIGKPDFGLMVTDGSFPELNTAEELIEPLIYLTTSEERKKLYSADEPKYALDEFWLDIAGEKSLARQLIRTYYQRVATTNKLFTSHKEGWKTDRGMIYIVLGQPEVVHHFHNREEWIYYNMVRGSGVKFIFMKKQNTFTQNHYELIRDRSYEQVWYGKVDQWRNGIIEK